MDVTQVLGIVLPALSGLGVAWIKATQADKERRLVSLEGEMDKVRKRSHDLTAQVQGLPSSLEPHFVERREWEQAQKAGEAIHLDHARRISDLERRR